MSTVSLGDKARVGTLMYTKLDPPIITTKTETLQEVCDNGNTTTTDVNLTTGSLNTTKINTTAADRLIIEGRVSIGKSVAPNYELEIQGNLAPTIEIKDLPFSSILRMTAFDANSTIQTVGAFPLNLKVDSLPRIEMKTNNQTVFYNSTGLDCFNVNGATDLVSVTRGGLVVNNSITSTTGDFLAPAGRMIANDFIRSDTGNILAATGDVYANTGDVYSISGNLRADAGGVLAPLGNSKFNRMEFNTYFGGSSYGSPIAITSSSPYNAFTIPTNTYNFVLFATHASSGSTFFPFELHTSITDVLKDYSLIVSAQTANNNGGASLGYTSIVSGDSVSDPTNKSKITVIINTAVGATVQVMKFIVKLEYTPSP